LNHFPIWTTEIQQTGDLTCHWRAVGWQQPPYQLRG